MNINSNIDIRQAFFSLFSITDKILLNTIMTFSKKNQVDNFTQSRLAELLGVCRKTITRSVQRLTKKNLLFVESQGFKKPLIYKVNPLVFSIALIIAQSIHMATGKTLDKVFVKPLKFSCKKIFTDRGGVPHNNNKELYSEVLNCQPVTIPLSTPLNLFNSIWLSNTKGCLKEYTTLMHNGENSDWVSTSLEVTPVQGDTQQDFFKKNIKEKENKLTSKQLDEIFNSSNKNQLSIEEDHVMQSQSTNAIAPLKLNNAIRKATVILSLKLHGQAKLYALPEDIIEEALSTWDVDKDERGGFSLFFNKCLAIAQSKNIKPDYQMYKMIRQRYQIQENDPFIDADHVSELKRKRISDNYVKQNESPESKKSGRLPVYVPPVVELDYDKECEYFYQAVLDGKVFKGYELTYPPFMGWLERNPDRIPTLEKYLGRKIDVNIPESILAPYKSEVEEEQLNDQDLIKEMSVLKQTLSDLMGNGNDKNLTRFTSQNNHVNKIENDLFDDEPIFFDNANHSDYEEVYD